jgi:hypothetical protein
MKLWNKEAHLKRVLDAAKVLLNELDRYEKVINEEINFRKRVMMAPETDRKLHLEDQKEIQHLQNIFPVQLRRQLGRWLKRVVNEKRDIS